jgi:hypothetical protein
MSQLDLLTWPGPTSRNGDRMTSHEAATRAGMRASEGRMLVLLNLTVKPMTDFELAAETGWQQTSIGKRRHECLMNSLVERALDGRGEEVRRPSPSGSPALVWAITQAGREYYKQHSREAA